MENSPIQNLDLDEEKIQFLLDNIDKIPQILNQEQIDSLILKLKENLSFVEKSIDLLQSTSDSIPD